MEASDRLVDSGKSVIVIEHHRAVMAHADWITTTPTDLGAESSTLTGEHLAAFVVGSTTAGPSKKAAFSRKKPR